MDHSPSPSPSPSPVPFAAIGGRTASPAPSKTSNLTSALQGAARADTHTTPGAAGMGPSMNGSSGDAGTKRHDSFGGGGMSASTGQNGGARPISMKNANRERPRRESVAGSMVGAMSWGGISVGSWIRDDIIMTGTSPFAYQTPSYHSSSYLPKLEANFMRDFSCCGITLPSLHDLQQHYEDSHAQTAQAMPRSSQAGPGGPPTSAPSSKAAIAAGAAAAVQQQAQMGQRPSNAAGQPLHGGHPGVLGTSSMAGMSAFRDPMQTQRGDLGKSALQPTQEIDVVEDMEMDDDVNVRDVEHVTSPADGPQPSPLHSLPPPALLNQQNKNTMKPQLPPLNLAGTHFVHSVPPQHQGLRNSQPSTPSSLVHSGRPLQHNPTVSSVNTPTLSTHPLQQRQDVLAMNGSPATARPLGGDHAFDGMGSEMSTPVTAQLSSGYNRFGFGQGQGYDMLDLCIDEPAKRLFSQNGSLLGQAQHDQFSFGAGPFGDDGDFTKKGKGPHRMTGMGDHGSGMFLGDDYKPFRCPVIGCEKAYKNQNGLKYHKTHGHTNQQLHENPDGTFSIVNPETCIPYPGTLGMEKEKPYGCENCGKRYKNLNGLKYHKAHSPSCNPETRLAAGLGALAGTGGPGIGVSGMGGLGVFEENTAVRETAF